VIAKQAANLSLFTQDHFDSQSFMMETQDFFHHMRKRSMAHVMKQCRSPRSRAILFLNGVFFTESIEYASHEMKRAERMSEA
jgi:hypothetical protein